MSDLVEPSQPAPEFTLPDGTGRPRRLEDFRGSWVVLYFYPRDATPGCTTEACDFRDAMNDLKQADAVVLGVSPDDAASHTKFAQKQALNFPLLADTNQKVCQDYGVWKEKSMYGKTFMGVARTTYLIDPDGNVAYRWDKVKVKGHVDAVLAKLKELAASA
jgi:peroxiredoxin Q/BCP